MTLEQVEAIAGRGEEVVRGEVAEFGQPRRVDGKLTYKVVEGDRFFHWRYNDYQDSCIWVSFKNNRVAEKHFSFIPLL